LHLGHVADEAVERELRRRHGPALATLFVDALTFEDERGAVELEPRLEHLALSENVWRLRSPWVGQVLDHAGGSSSRSRRRSATTSPMGSAIPTSSLASTTMRRAM